MALAAAALPLPPLLWCMSPNRVIIEVVHSPPAYNTPGQQIKKQDEVRDYFVVLFMG